MRTMIPQINLLAAWAGILLGFLSGMALGMFFHREDWLGGYGSFKRRMYRLGHISFFGLGAVNLMFWLTATVSGLNGDAVVLASWAFIIGTLTMPLCCVLMAHFPSAHALFAVPVMSLIAGGAVMLYLVVQGLHQPPPNLQLSTFNSL